MNTSANTFFSGWRFTLLVCVAVTIAGFGVDFALAGRGFPAPSRPDNLVALAAVVLLQGAIWLALRRHPLMAGLGGTRLAITTFVFLCGWAVCAGSLPQVVRGEHAPIIQRVIQAPPFVFLLLLLLTNLGWGTLNHLAKGWRGSSLFLANHLGIYVVLAAGLFGAGEVVRLDVWVKEGELGWTGSDGKTRYEMPFAIHLHEFKIERFEPQLTIIDAATGEILLPRGADPLTLRHGARAGLLGYQIEVLEAAAAAPWSVAGDPIPAARVRATADGGARYEGWVSCGSSLMPPIFLPAGEVAFAMPVPRSRSYESRITLVRPEQEPLDAAILVNRPLVAAGWWIYQKGYNIDGGPLQRYSQFEAVRDPWLPVVYTGFAAMAVGALLGLGRAGILLRSIAPIEPTGAGR